MEFKTIMAGNTQTMAAQFSRRVDLYPRIYELIETLVQTTMGRFCMTLLLLQLGEFCDWGSVEDNRIMYTDRKTFEPKAPVNMTKMHIKIVANYTDLLEFTGQQGIPLTSNGTECWVYFLLPDQTTKPKSGALIDQWSYKWTVDMIEVAT